MKQRDSIWMWIVLIVFSALCFVIALIPTDSHRLEEVNQVLQHGVRVQGQVTQVVWTKSGNWVHYVFQVNGSEYTGKSPLGAMASPAVGQSIPIVYLPSNPHINTLANGAEADVLQGQIRALRFGQVLEVPLGVLAVGYLRNLGKRYVRGK